MNPKKAAKHEVYNPLVSIVVPTYNEETDIRRTLDALVALDYPNREVIVVDDSTDNTTSIVKEYERHGVRLFRRGNRDNGCCGARNKGILEAKGEIVVLLNADVFPDKDFLDRILPHYKKGADYLLVWQKVANTQYLYPRFVEAESDLMYGGQDWIEWTEGFSCRRAAAIDVGMLPGDFPLPFCRDWMLGKKLGEKYKKAIDRSIVVRHVAPHTLKDFWRVRKTRTRFAFFFNYFIGSVSMKKLMNGEPLERVITKHSLPFLILRTTLKTMRNLVKIATVVPILSRCIAMAMLSPKGSKDIVPFLGAYLIQTAAFSVGEWGGCKEIIARKYFPGRTIGHSKTLVGR